MPRNVNFVMPQFPAQRFEIVNQVLERLGCWRNGTITMAAQIIADAGKVLPEAFNQFVPGGLARADAMYQVKRGTLSFNSIADFYRGHHFGLGCFGPGICVYGKLRHDFFRKTLNGFQHLGLFNAEIDIHDETIDTGLGIGCKLVDHFSRRANG